MLRLITKDGERPVAYFIDSDTLAACLPDILSEVRGAVVIDNPGYKIDFVDGCEITICYFESTCHADRVAVFSSKHLYNVCTGALVKLAKKHRMVVTESVCPEEEAWKEPLWQNLRDELDYKEEKGEKGWMKRENQNITGDFRKK